MTWSLQPGKDKGPAGIGGEYSYSSAEQQQQKQQYYRGNNNNNNDSNKQQLVRNDSYIENTSDGQYSNDKQPKFDFYATVPSAHSFRSSRASTTEIAFIHRSAPSSIDMDFTSSPFSDQPNIVASQELEGRGMNTHHPSSTSFYTGNYYIN